MKEKYLVLWKSSHGNEPIQTSLDNLDQICGALSAIKDNDGVLYSIIRCFVDE